LTFDLNFKVKPRSICWFRTYNVCHLKTLATINLIFLMIDLINTCKKIKVHYLTWTFISRSNFGQTSLNRTKPAHSDLCTLHVLFFKVRMNTHSGLVSWLLICVHVNSLGQIVIDNVIWLYVIASCMCVASTFSQKL
jgi:hypothetical protein